MPRNPFRAEQFTPTHWATAEQKAQWANAMALWVLRDFPQNGFTKRLYIPLSTHLYGHISHFNREGFSARWFRDIHRQLQDAALVSTDPCPPGMMDNPNLWSFPH